MDRDYSQPFCIRGPHSGKFWHGYEERGYLPALEPPSEEPEEEAAAPQQGIGYYQLQKEIEQLKGALNFLEGKINEHVDASKRKRKGSW